MPIKLFHAGQIGAPQLSGSNGSLIGVLDAVLVNGYNSVSITSITRSGGTATVATSVAHGLSSGDSATISGATQAEYNVEAIVSVIDSTNFSYSVAGAPVTPATGAPAVKRASGGFSKEFAGTNKAVYRSLNTALTCRPYLQVIDAGATAGAAKEAQVRGYMTMTDIDTGGEPFPSVAQLAGGLFAYKSNLSSAAARPWVLITDGNIFYFQACMDQAPASMQASGGYLWWLAFGDIAPTRPLDPYCGILAACGATNQQVTGLASACINGLFYGAARNFNIGAGSAFYLPRSFGQVVGAVTGSTSGHGWDQIAMGSLALLAYPHPPDNGFYMTPVNVTQGGVIRGRLPGVYEPLQGRCLNQFDTVQNVDGYPGRTFMALWGQNAQSTSTTGMLMFDLTGPWS